MMEDFLFHHTETSSYMKRRNIAITPGGKDILTQEIVSI